MLNLVYSSHSTAADGTTPITVTGIPPGSSLAVRFEGGSEDLHKVASLEETEVELTFSEAGKYEVQIQMTDVTDAEGETWGHYDMTTMVEAT